MSLVQGLVFDAVAFKQGIWECVGCLELSQWRLEGGARGARCPIIWETVTAVLPQMPCAPGKH